MSPKKLGYLKFFLAVSWGVFLWLGIILMVLAIVRLVV